MRKIIWLVMFMLWSVPIYAQTPVPIFVEAPEVPAFVDEDTKETQDMYEHLLNRVRGNRRFVVVNTPGEAVVVLKNIERKKVITGHTRTKTSRMGGVLTSSTEDDVPNKGVTVELHVKGQQKILEAQVSQTFLVNKDLSARVVKQIEKLMKDNAALFTPADPLTSNPKF